MHTVITPSERQPDTTPASVEAQINAACRVHDAAVAAYAAGQADVAEVLFRQALALFECSEGVDHPDVAAVLGSLGTMYEERCAYPAAVQCFERAATIVEASPDGGEEELAQLRVRALSGWGRLLRRQGRYDQAATVLRRALTYAEQRFGPESRETAWALNDLGMLGKYAGWFAAAEQCYHRALALIERHYGPDGVEAAALYHNLGGLEHARGRFAVGESLARQAVALRERVCGPDHPDVARSLAALAALLDGQGQYAEAEGLYHRALDIFFHIYGAEHDEIAVYLNNLAALHQQRGEFATAEEMYCRALAMKESLFGGDSVEAALTANNLGTLYKAQGRMGPAARLFRRALAVLEAALGPEHPHVIVCRQNDEEVRHMCSSFLAYGPTPYPSVASNDQARGARFHPGIVQASPSEPARGRAPPWFNSGWSRS